ncbi:MAG TPA: patatin-like phospholipase family protein [Acidimicrobiales bacterium]|nr:patatin-like phospholipase family protein [Acidimicrobiales bacterium]
MAEGTRVALALGSGGARGYAHIGVIEVLEERGFEIVSIAGSSMGALVGGLHAAGTLAPYTEWVRGLRQRDVVRLLDVSLSAPGAIRAEKILARVRELLAGALIEDLPIAFTAVATDLLARKEVWFQKGRVDVAIRASIAIPTVITPVMLNGRLLADGALTNPVPIAPTASAQADLTVAVSVAGDGRDQLGTTPVHETAEERPVEEWTERFRAGASQLLDRELVRTLRGRFGAASATPTAGIAPLAPSTTGATGAPATPAGTGGGAGTAAPGHDPFGALPAGLGKFDMMNESLDTMQSVLTRYRLAGFPPDVLVSVPRDSCRSLDFHRAAEMIAIGRKLAAEALDRAGLTDAGSARS